MWREDSLWGSMQLSRGAGKEAVPHARVRPDPEAPKGNRNALKSGLHTREALADRQMLSGLIRRSRELLSEIE